MKPKKLKKLQQQLKPGLIIATLLLLGHSTLAQFGAPAPLQVSLRLEELGGEVVPHCSQGPFMTDIMDNVQGNGFNKVLALYLNQIKLGTQSCVQGGQFTQFQATSPFIGDRVAETWTLTQLIRENTANPATIGLNSYGTTLPTGYTLSSLRSLVISSAYAVGNFNPKGVFIFLFQDQFGLKSYASVTLDGLYACFPSCQTCSGPQRNQCTACKPFSPIQGASIDAALTGQCLCALGDANKGGTACQKNRCHKSCKSCSGTGASQCVLCDDGYEPQEASGGLRKCKRKPKPGEGGNPGQPFACHNTCDECRGERKDQCTKCSDLSEDVNLSFKAGECRCPRGKYLTEDEDACADCHSSCSKCTGPGADQCITCTNHLGTPIKAAGAKAGTCVNCADPAVANTAPCQGKITRFKITAGAKTKPETAESIANEEFNNPKNPDRVRQHKIPLDFGETIINLIKALGSDFNFSEFMNILIAGLVTPADYTFTTAINEADNTYEVIFEFKGSHQKLGITFSVLQSNYFQEHLPTPTDGRRLQELSAANQAVLDSSVLVVSEPIQVELEGVYNVDQNKVDFMEETGVVIRVYTYASIFIASLALVMTMLGSKYDGRFVGRILDYSFFLCFLAKVPYIPAGYNTY